MKLLSKIVAGALLVSSINASDINVYSTQDNKAINFQTVGAMYKNLGFSVQAVSKLDAKFKKEFNDTTFDKFKILAVYDKGLTEKLINKYPLAGIFVPFSVVLQSKSDSNDVTFTTLNTDTIKKVLGISKCELLDKLEDKNNKIASTFGFDTTKAKEFDYKVAKPDGELLYKKEINAKDAKAVADKLTNIMKEHKFSILNELNLKDEYKTLNEKYDYYTTFSICKVKVLFQSVQTKPEAAAFAPCSLLVYKEKGSDKVTVAFPSTYNWLSSLDMKDEKAIKILRDEQKEIEGFINSL